MKLQQILKKQAVFEVTYEHGNDDGDGLTVKQNNSALDALLACLPVAVAETIYAYTKLGNIKLLSEYIVQLEESTLAGLKHLDAYANVLKIPPEHAKARFIIETNKTKQLAFPILHAHELEALNLLLQIMGIHNPELVSTAVEKVRSIITTDGGNLSDAVIVDITTAALSYNDVDLEGDEAYAKTCFQVWEGFTPAEQHTFRKFHNWGPNVNSRLIYRYVKNFFKKGK